MKLRKKLALRGLRKGFLMDILKSYGLFCAISFMFPFLLIVPVFLGADITGYSPVVWLSWILALFFLGLCLYEIIVMRESAFNKEIILTDDHKDVTDALQEVYSQLEDEKLPVYRLVKSSLACITKEWLITGVMVVKKKNIVCMIKRTDQKSTYATLLIDNGTWITTFALAKNTFPHFEELIKNGNPHLLGNRETVEILEADLFGDDEEFGKSDYQDASEKISIIQSASFPLEKWTDIILEEYRKRKKCSLKGN